MKPSNVLATFLLTLSFALPGCDSSSDKKESKPTAGKVTTQKTESKPDDKAAPKTTPAPATKEAKPAAPATGPRVGTEKGFTVVLPAGFRTPTPTTTRVPVAAINATITATIWASANRKQDQVLVSVNAYPVAEFEKVSTKKFFDDARTGALNNVRGKMLSEKDHVVAGQPARTVYFRFSQGAMRGFGRVQMVAAKPRLLQVLYVSRSRKSLDTPEVQAMFDSLVLVDTKAPSATK